MLSYCLKYRKKEESKSPTFAKTQTEKPMLLSKRAVCDSKKSRFIKEQEASGFLKDTDKDIISHLVLLGKTIGKKFSS